MWIHLTARSSLGRPLVARGPARWLWLALRRRWPDALAACLMPDHLHLLLSTRDARADRESLSHVLGSFTRRVEAGGWSVASPEAVRSIDHARRTVRYIHLNPCRARLTDDPLAWGWSTHRGLVGAELDPWVTSERLARALGSPPSDFARHLHRFVSGDPSVSAGGTPFPKPAPRRSSPDLPLTTVVAAAAAATPWSAPPIFHRIAVLLARHQAWSDTTAIAHALLLSSRTVRRIAHESDPLPLRAAALCLGDERLVRDGLVAAA